MSGIIRGGGGGGSGVGGGGGGGATALAQLTDVDLETFPPIDFATLLYAAGKFYSVRQALPGLDPQYGYGFNTDETAFAGDMLVFDGLLDNDVDAANEVGPFGRWRHEFGPPIFFPVVAIATEPIDLESPPADIDGINVASGGGLGGAGAFVALTAQPDPADNGFYDASGGWERPRWANQPGHFRPGKLILVLLGDTYAGTIWRLTSDIPGVIGTDPINIEQIPTGGSAGGGGAAVRTQHFTSYNFEDLTRLDQNIATGAGGFVSVGPSGVAIGEGNTFDVVSELTDPYGSDAALFDDNLRLSAEFYSFYANPENSFVSYILVGGIRNEFAATDLNQKHVGFICRAVDGVVELFGACGDGAGNTEVSLAAAGSLESTNGVLVLAKMTSGEKVEFYVNGELAGTITTNLPSGLPTRKMSAGIINVSGSDTDEIDIRSVAVAYDAAPPEEGAGGGGGGGGGTSITHKKLLSTSEAVPSGGSEDNPPAMSGITLDIAAVEGDDIEVTLDCTAYLDASNAVAGIGIGVGATNYLRSKEQSQAAGWKHFNVSVVHTVVSGDIAGGNVTVTGRAQTNSGSFGLAGGTAKTLLEVKNLGPAAA